MPSFPEVLPFEASRCEEAGRLLAARHRREREQFPILPARFEDPSQAADVVRATMEYADGAAAIDASGALTGFLFGFQNVPAPTSPSARYAPERSSMLLAHGHAVSQGANPFHTYYALFGWMGEQYRRLDITDHFAHVPAGDREVEGAWFALGFGRANAVAARDLRPVEAPINSALLIRVATPEDLDVVDRLVDEESRFHARSPIMRPYLREQTKDAVRRQLAESLADAERAHLIARLDGDDAGIIAVGPARGSPLYIPEGAAYIGDTAVLPAARGEGVGAALVDAAMAWARSRGHRAATLHFATANAVSSSFWMGLGFAPVMWHLWRRLDERITWAQTVEEPA